ncbi:MAG TPA: anti-sigma factor [Allosphingosinicella sp.]|nr:anti-sigma factor [Allosphingosinicella sp.]
MTPATHEERDTLAAEYALGLLEGEARAEAQRLESADPEFRASLARWLGRLAPLLDEVEPVQPRARVWARLESRFGPQAAGPVQEPPSNIVQLRRKVVLWRSWAAGATAIAASLALFLVTRPDAPPAVAPAAAPAPMVAMLEAGGSEAKLAATYDPAAGTLVVVPAVLNGAAGHEHQLWLIPRGGSPHPIGMVRPGQPMRMKMPGEMMPEMERGAVLAVSVEPTGGSPTGLPTGPVIASGRFSRS